MVSKSPHPDIEIADVSLPHFVTERFQDYGDRIAFIDGVSGHCLSYDELFRDIQRVAFSLHARGFTKGDTLALYSPNCSEYAVFFYAVSFLGGINTTINPSYTVSELTHQLIDSAARFLVVTPETEDRALEAAEKSSVEQVITIGDTQRAIPYTALLGSEKYTDEVSINPAEDIAALPYSSGTTGLPKGVMLTHSNLVANIAQTESVEHVADDVTIGILPFYHIYGMTVIMSTVLRNGATIVTMPRFDLEHFLHLMQENEVTVAYLVPPIILALAKHPLVDNYDLSSLRKITSGAAPLPVSVARACAERLGCVVKQGYGLTETSPVTHITPDVDTLKLDAVGPGLPNTETMVVDVETQEPLPRGQKGEIWIRGPQVMKGYHRNPEATAAMIDADRWLHTGDVGYLDEQGYLYVVDRVKELIKYKGLQIAPAELEAVIVSHPDVADAAVIPSPDEEAGEVPKAFVVRKPGKNTAADAIMEYVSERVAPYKKIRKVEFVEQIPKVPSGKILRRKLVELERSRQG